MNYSEKQLSAFTLAVPQDTYKLQIVGGDGTKTRYLDLDLDAIMALEKFLKREKARLSMQNVSCCDQGIDG